METIRIPYGNATKQFRLPKENLIGVYSPHDFAAVPDVSSEVIRAIHQPIGTLTIRELAKGAQTVVLVADDNTRLTPADRIIPVVLDELNAAGVRDEQITVLIALGTHRLMTSEEILLKFGEAVVRRVTIKNHDYKNLDQLEDLGETPNGTKILVNKAVVQADFKIGIGSIVPHVVPGFAGGAKIVQPGISGEQTTAGTHLLGFRSPRLNLGLRDNPVRAELNSIARAVGLNTIINTVLNRHGEVAGVFYGDTVAAFNAGVALAEQVYSVAIPEQADIVVAGSFPCDLEFWQAHKALYPAGLAVKAGGIIILTTPCPEGVAVMHADALALTHLSIDEIERLLSRKAIPDEVAASAVMGWARVKEHAFVYLVSDGISDTEAKQLGFTPYGSIDAALSAAFAQQGRAARVTVLTHAPDMLPVIPENDTSKKVAI